MHIFLHFAVKGSDGAFKFCCFRNDVGPYSAVKLTNGDHHRGDGQVLLTAHNGLKVVDDLCAHNNGVYASPWRGTMGLLSFDFDGKPIGGSHHRSAFVFYFANFKG